MIEWFASGGFIAIMLIVAMFWVPWVCMRALREREQYLRSTDGWPRSLGVPGFVYDASCRIAVESLQKRADQWRAEHQEQH